MTDYEILKEALTRIKCKYETTQTLIGYTITVKSIANTIYYEFDHTGSFNRVI
ncbi:MAG: hypothetical protein ACOWWH_12490 [Eubacteriaceae bacterium]